MTLRRKVLALILGIIVKDGRVSHEEEELLDRMYAAFDISPNDTWIRPVGDAEEAAAALREMPAAVQRQALELLVEMAAVDGAVPPSEQAYLDVVAEAVGWSADELEAHIVEMLSGSAGK